MFESSLYLNQIFFKEIESKKYSFVTRFNFRALYLLIHQYKFTLLKHCQLFDFQTWDTCVYILLSSFILFLLDLNGFQSSTLQMEHGGYREMIEKWTIYGDAVFLHKVEHQILYSILIFLMIFFICYHEFIYFSYWHLFESFTPWVREACRDWCWLYGSCPVKNFGEKCFCFSLCILLNANICFL